MKRNLQQDEEIFALSIFEVLFKICSYNIRCIIFSECAEYAEKHFLGIRSLLRSCKATYILKDRFLEKIYPGVSGLLGMALAERDKMTLQLTNMAYCIEDAMICQHNSTKVHSLTELQHLLQYQTRLAQVNAKILHLNKLLLGF